MAIQMEAFTNVTSSSISNPSEGKNVLFIAGYNSLLLNDNTRAARDFYLLLMIYVNYFLCPVLSFFLNSLSRFGNSIQRKFSKRTNSVYIAIAFFMESKEYISKLSFSQKKQVEFVFLSRNSYRKTVLL
jgi:uncharacterized UPF0160 family protein